MNIVLVRNMLDNAVIALKTAFEMIEKSCDSPFDDLSKPVLHVGIITTCVSLIDPKSNFVPNTLGMAQVLADAITEMTHIQSHIAQGKYDINGLVRNASLNMITLALKETIHAKDIINGTIDYWTTK